MNYSVKGNNRKQTEVRMITDNENKRFIIILNNVTELEVKEKIGTKVLYLLINNPNYNFKTDKLRCMLEGPINISQQDMREFDLSTNDDIVAYRSLFSYIPATDRKTVMQVRKEIKKLSYELDIAEQNNDLGMIDYYLDQLNKLNNYLMETCFPNGQIRNLNNIPKNCRKSINRALNHELDIIREECPILGEILDKRIVTKSNTLSYRN